MVALGAEQAKIDEELLDMLREQERAIQKMPQRLFVLSGRTLVTKGSFAGSEAIFQMADGTSWLMVLIELLSRAVQMSIASTDLCKIS
jgi:transcriptional antiterminator RfaH